MNKRASISQWTRRLAQRFGNDSQREQVIVRSQTPISLWQVTTVPESLGFIKGHSAYLRKRGIETTVISSSGDELAKFAAEERANAIALRMTREITPAADLISLWHFVWKCIAYRPDIVHARTPKAGLLAMLGSWVTCRPVRVYSILGLPYLTAVGRRRLLLRWSETISCSLAHSVICVSESMRNVAIEDKLTKPSKLYVLARGSVNGIDAENHFNPRNYSRERESLRERLNVGQSGHVIGYVGRIVRDKGVHELAQAWQLVLQEFPSSHLVLLGAEEPQDPIAQEVLCTLRNDRRVHLLGHVDNPAEWYAACDLVVLASYREGFPNVLLEAAAMELPVVTTRIPGCIDAVEDSVTGMLVPPRDADALGVAIQTYLRDPDLRVSHGHAGRARVIANYNQETIWESTYHVYHRLLETKGIPCPLTHSETSA